jgi:predicted  nucleic acid-binding Zn-ribbon protein
MRMTPEERRDQMHATREMIRNCSRTCSGCHRGQGDAKLAEIETLPDDGYWYCEHCGREHCIV